MGSHWIFLADMANSVEKNHIKSSDFDVAFVHFDEMIFNRTQ